MATAAAERASADASITSTTGAPSHLASCAVEPASVEPSRPSNSPMTPSTTATSAQATARWNAPSTCSRLSIQVSRLMEGRPVAAMWCMGSRKSGIRGAQGRGDKSGGHGLSRWQGCVRDARLHAHKGRPGGAAGTSGRAPLCCSPNWQPTAAVASSFTLRHNPAHCRRYAARADRPYLGLS